MAEGGQGSAMIIRLDCILVVTGTAFLRQDYLSLSNSSSHCTALREIGGLHWKEKGGARCYIIHSASRSMELLEHTQYSSVHEHTQIAHAVELSQRKRSASGLEKPVAGHISKSQLQG